MGREVMKVLGSPKNNEVIEVLTLRRLAPERLRREPEFQWLICNGMSMGRWTLHFGVHCLADQGDNRKFVRYHHEENPGSKICVMHVHTGDHKD